MPLAVDLAGMELGSHHWRTDHAGRTVPQRCEQCRRHDLGNEATAQEVHRLVYMVIERVFSGKAVLILSGKLNRTWCLRRAAL
jgi:hypothetical protein